MRAGTTRERLVLASTSPQRRAILEQLRIAFEVRKALPQVPARIKAREANGEVAAAWLAGLDDGAWRFEAVRQLRALPQNETITGLIAALEKGWLPRLK